MPNDETGTFRNALARLLDAPQRQSIVRHLPPETLHRLIHRSGLDACGEIVALATPAQLASVFDVDLWHQPQPGQDACLDADRFGEWLELLADAGPAVAAHALAAMGEPLASAGLSRHVRVFDGAAIAPVASDDEEFPRGDLTCDTAVECEIGGYVVRSVRADAWEAIVSVLAALSEDHPVLFHVLMRSCRAVSNSPPEIDGLDALLDAPGQLLHDVALDRDDRRSRQGYSTAADSRAFLEMARSGKQTPSEGLAQNPIVAGYFRAMDEPAASTDAAARQLPAVPGNDAPDAMDAMAELLVEPGFAPRPLALLDEGDAAGPRLARIRLLMAHVRDHHETAFIARVQELAFLVNTIAAGCSIQARALTPREASEAVICTCNLGLELWPGRWPNARLSSSSRSQPDDFLSNHDLITAFEAGWAMLHDQVSLYTAERLGLALAPLRCDDGDVRAGVHALRFELKRQREAGTPWKARRALEVLAMIDVAAWAGVSGLLDQCPVIAAALTATLEGRIGPVSATAFEFISTRSQLDLIRAFVTRLPAILAAT